MSDTRPDRDAATLADYEAFVAAKPENERWELIGGVIVGDDEPDGDARADRRQRLRSPQARDGRGGMPDLCGRRARAALRRARRGHGDPARLGGALRSPAATAPSSRTRSSWSRSCPARRCAATVAPSSTSTAASRALRHIALIYQGQMRVEHYRRVPEGWVLEVPSSPSGRLAFDAVGFSVDLETIYFDIPRAASRGEAGGRGLGSPHSHRMTSAP